MIKAAKCLVLNIYIQGSFKKCLSIFGQVEMDFVIVLFFDNFTPEPVPSMNGIWIITFVSHLHVWVTKFKPSLMFFQAPVLTSKDVIWVNFSAIFFDEAQHVIKTVAAGYVPFCYEVINAFIKPQNFLLMGFICKLKGLYLTDTACDGLLVFFLYFLCKLLSNMRKQHIAAVSSEVFCLWLLA